MEACIAFRNMFVAGDMWAGNLVWVEVARLARMFGGFTEGTCRILLLSMIYARAYNTIFARKGRRLIRPWAC